MAMANDPDGFDSRIPVAQRQGSMAAVKKSGNILSRYPVVAAYRVETTVSRRGMPRTREWGATCPPTGQAKDFSWLERFTPYLRPPYPTPGYRAEGIDPRIADVEAIARSIGLAPSSCRVAFATASVDSSASFRASATFSMRSSPT